MLPDRDVPLEAGRAPIEAAGGIVWRRGLTGPRIAVIHRSRYGDWTLPKGKRERGETLRETAEREVREELGVRVRVRRFAGRTRHLVGGVPKDVSYWHMESLGPAGALDAGEVDRIEWLPPNEALARLDYASERELLASVVAIPLTRRPSWRVGRWDVERERLAAALASLRLEIGRRSVAPLPLFGARSWREIADELLDAAEDELALGRIDAGWRALHAAERMELYGLAPSELAARADALRREGAVKLSGWRREAIELALGTGAAEANGEKLSKRERKARERAARAAVDPDRLHFATRLRDEHFANEYYKLRLSRRRMQVLLGVLAADLALLALSAEAWWFDPDARIPIQAPAEGAPRFLSLLLGMILFGALGGAWSALRSVATSTRSQRIPEQLGGLIVTAMRPLVGAAGALAAFLLLRAGLLDLREAAPPVVLAIAFAAGFSESLVLRGIGALAGDAESDRVGPPARRREG